MSADYCSAHRLQWISRAKGREMPGRCDQPNWMGCLECGSMILTRCDTADCEACKPCGERYRRRVRVIAESGVTVAKAGEFVFMTFTAPGDKAHGYRGFRCPCTPEGGVDLAKWNGECVHHWNRLQQAIERDLGVEFAYFKAVEVQHRGALHLHVMARFERAVVLRTSRLRALAMRHGFGHSVDLQRQGGQGAARYCAKYVSKSASERVAVPYLHRRTGERGGRWRTWTASRDWGLTMSAVKAAQQEWAREHQGGGAGVSEGSQETAAPAPLAAPLDPNTAGYASAPVAEGPTVTR